MAIKIGNDFQEFCQKLNGKSVMFLGLGRSNIPLIKMLDSKKIKIIVSDRREEIDLKSSINELNNQDIEYRLGKDYLKKMDIDIIFRTPGINFNLEFLSEARKKGIIVTSEMELFFDLCPCEIIGITGITENIIDSAIRALNNLFFIVFTPFK